MSTGICSCEEKKFGNTGRPNCVIEQKALAFPIVVPRFGSNGSRNSLDLSVDPTTLLDPNGDAGNYASFGDYIKDKCENPAWAAEDRFYCMPRVESATFERTETVYETAPSTRKYKVEGVGGVRTWAMQLWAKAAVSGMHRELSNYGCSELDVFYVDIAGAIWGIKDDSTTSVIRGYEMSAETWDVFKEYATDTTVGKLMVSFDLDNEECEENSYGITAGELGYKATSLKGLISAYSTAEDPTDTTIEVVLITGYGTASKAGTITGLDNAAFTVTSDISGELAHTVAAVESPDGTYLLTMDVALVSGHVITVDTIANGYSVDSTKFTV